MIEIDWWLILWLFLSTIVYFSAISLVFLIFKAYEQEIILKGVKENLEKFETYYKRIQK